MKKVMSVIMTLVIIFSFAAISVYGEESDVPTVVFYVKEMKYIIPFTTEGGTTPDVPLVGKPFAIGWKTENCSGLSGGKVKIAYNGDVMMFATNSMLYELICSPDSWDDVNLDANELMASKGNNGYNLFFVKKVGKIDFSATAEGFKDKEGNNVQVKVDTSALPLYSHNSEDVPFLKLDSDICFNHDNSTELSGPMTVSDFASSITGTNEAEITDKDGNALGEDDMIPTGAKIKLVYDNVEMAESTFVLIGDVDCDGAINASDARRILRVSAEIDSGFVCDAAETAANVSTSSTEITVSDAREVLKHSIGTGNDYSTWYNYHTSMYNK